MNKKLILLGLVFLLCGCSPALDKLHFQMALKGVKPLSAEQVKSLYSNATSQHKAEHYEFSGFYSTDGFKTGKSWGDWGGESDQGIWHVTDEGLLCGEWLGGWAKGTRCLSVYPGEVENEFIETVVVGPRFRSNPSGIYHVKIIPGDATNLEYSLTKNSINKSTKNVTSN